MPDAAGNIKGIATTGKAGETIEKIFRDCGQRPETCKWGDACADCRIEDEVCHKMIRSGRHPIRCDLFLGHNGICISTRRQPCVRY